MTPEQELLLAIVRQAMRDYMALDPDSDKVSAEHHIDVANDFKTAEDFLFNNVPINYINMQYTLSDITTMLGMSKSKLLRRISKEATEY